MWKPLATILCCGFAALPLIGCAGHITAARQQGALPPVGVARTASAADTGPRVYASSSASPAAILVLVPSTGAFPRDDVLVDNPGLWAAQGFDVVTPPPSEIY